MNSFLFRKNVSNVDNDEEDEVDPIGLAAALESKSAHPLANAVVSGNYYI